MALGKRALHHRHHLSNQPFATGPLVFTLPAGTVMRLSPSMFSNAACRCFWNGCVIFILLILTGCETMTIQPPQVDTVRFAPMSTEKRVLTEPKIKYLVRADGFEYCARITGIPVTPTSRPMACAFWNVRRKECTIVTPLTTGFNYLGHELRHCFEGAFHD